MNENMERFIDSIESPNSQKVAKFALKNIDGDIENCSPIGLEQVILDKRPSSQKEIITIVYILSSYAKWLQEQGVVKGEDMYQMLQSIDKKLLWKKAKPTAKKKFISNAQFKRVIHDIEMYEEYNSLYYTTLFQSIYEGLYNDDLSVLKNLRKCDINDNIVTLREDTNHVYKIKVSEKLANDLRKLADINIWQRPNRFSICNVDMRGLHSDSVFKIEHRKTAVEDSYRFSYYARLRKITKEYLEYSLLPLQLYTSGVMNRIKVELEKNGISLEEAFADNSRHKMAHLIIQKELIRCNSSIETSNFRELVKGHLDSF